MALPVVKGETKPVPFIGEHIFKKWFKKTYIIAR
jgi:hypothetical protein